METPRRGRPKKLNLVTIDQAVEAIKEELRRRYNNEAIVNKRSYTKETLYNMRSDKRLTPHGDRRCALFDLDEVLSKLVG